MGSWLNRLYGKKQYQWLFEKMHFISLYGMNMGGGSHFMQSGEEQMVQILQDKYPGENKPLILDVGANKGDYTTMLAAQLKTEGKQPVFYLFEPNPALMPVLEQVASEVSGKIFALALGSRPEKLDLHIAASDTLSSLQNNAPLYDGMQYVGNITVPVETIDNIIESGQISKIHLLKIDVEGHEFEVLEGAKNAIAQRKIGIIQFEFGRGQIMARRYLFDFFNLLGKDYTLHRLLKNGLSAPLVYHPRLEVFQTTNIVALCKS